MTSFNVGSAHFTRILDLGSLEIGSNYLIRYRSPGSPRKDYIGIYRGLYGENPIFYLLYYRDPRYHDAASYNQWVAYTGPQNSGQLYGFDKGHVIKLTDFTDGDSAIFSLGTLGNSISQTKSPDEVTEETLSAAHNVTHKYGVVGQGNIFEFLQPRRGGKSKRSSRRKKKSTRRKKKNMKRRSFRR
jgi:hypothetical protein